MIVVASERIISANSSVQLSGNGRGGREVPIRRETVICCCSPK